MANKEDTQSEVQAREGGMKMVYTPGIYKDPGVYKENPEQEVQQLDKEVPPFDMERIAEAIIELRKLFKRIKDQRK